MTLARPLHPAPAGFDDRRNAEQMRSHDSIIEKRWRKRVEDNVARRRAARVMIEQRLAPEVEAPRLDDPAYLAPYSDIDEGREEKYESDESFYGVGEAFR